MSAHAVAARFALPGLVREVAPWGKGLINTTFRVSTDQAHGVLQRINRQVFPQPRLVMANLRRLEDYWHSLPPGLRLPRLVPTREGADWFEDAAGACWRMLEYLPGIVLAKVETARVAEALGCSLGRLHRRLAGLDPAAFADPLPGFHRTPAYLAALRRARAGWRGQNTKALESLCAWVEELTEWASGLDRARISGQLPLRIVHGDPKLDNLLFDARTLTPLAWVDLDTVGPGLVLYDIGDCVRSVCHEAGGVELDLIEPVLAGWWAELAGTLSAAEMRWVPEAIALLPFELGVRFLTDYLEGNRYFKVQDPEENLHRALDQFALARQALRRREDLQRLWRKLTLGL
ncbi:aminoglycoside phosphotransferase family protein [Methylothermus subterraneus]